MRTQRSGGRRSAFCSISFLFSSPAAPLTKSHLVRPARDGDTWQNHLGTFLLLVVAISDGKAKNIISNKRRAKQLERAKATKCDLLSEFVLAGKSQWLAALAEGEEEKCEKICTIISSMSGQYNQRHRGKN